MSIDYEQAAQIFKDKCRQEGRIITIAEFEECEDLPSNRSMYNHFGTGWQRKLAPDEIDLEGKLKHTDILNKCQKCSNYVVGGLCAREGNGLVPANSCEEVEE